MVTPSAGKRSPRKRRWLRLALSASTGVSIALALAAGCAGMCRPSWYHPVSVDAARLEADRDVYVRLTDDISAALNHRRPIEFALDEDRMNRLFVGRGEIWPDAGRWQLEGVEDPLIDLVPGGVRLAGVRRVGGMRLVVSIVLDARIDADRLHVAIRSARIGALPVPTGLLTRAAADMLRGADVPIELDADGALSAANEFVWPNPRQRYRIASLQFDEKQVRVRLEPLR